MARLLLSLAIALIGVVVLPGVARADCPDDVFHDAECANTATDAYIGLPRDQVIGLPKYPGDQGGSVVPVSDPNRPVYEYRTLADCDEAIPDSSSEDVLCSRALKACPADTVGPLSAIWRRTMQAGVEIDGWRRIGLTCHTDVAPGARPTITMADLKAQFMRTPWAKPSISSQPAGNTTLVNLRTFYRVNWSAAGFAPGEVDSSVLRGITVRIRPKLVGFTYVFGDGSSLGPTTSPGGVYPDGDVTHVYGQRGEFPVRVDTTFGAEFSLDGRTWDDIPSTVTVPGPTTTITVKEAKAVLVNN